MLIISTISSKRNGQVIFNDSDRIKQFTLKQQICSDVLFQTHHHHLIFYPLTVLYDKRNNQVNKYMKRTPTTNVQIMYNMSKNLINVCLQYFFYIPYICVRHRWTQNIFSKVNSEMSMNRKYHL